MRVSQMFGETTRETPAEADTVSHQLLLRAGYVRPLAAGLFSYLPPAQRALRKIEQILREEMDALGGQEINMPVVLPAELWQQSGRWDAVDATLARFRDRRRHDLLLAMTHEEVVAALAHSEIHSYRQLPQIVYQIQTKFRDEARPRAGLIRAREFVMKDSYSLDRDEAGLRRAYLAHYHAYFRIGARVGLPLVAARSDPGLMGGGVAHEFVYLTPAGEDTLVLCGQCGYAANQEVARFAKEPSAPDAPRPLEKVHTPGQETIAGLAQFLGIDEKQTAKVVFFTGDYGPDCPARLLMVLVRGDMDANRAAVQHSSGARELRPARPEEITAAGAVPGYASPVGLQRDRVLVLVDDLVASSNNLVAGANEPGYHLRNTCCGRDYQPDVVGHLALAGPGARCAVCGQPLRLERGIEVGNLFQLGTRYSAALGACYTGESGERLPVVMGSYGIGVGRLLACVAQEHHDEHGLAWPIAVAPYQVALVSLAKKEEARQAAQRLYGELEQAGVEVLYDDRDASPGVKFTDADLRGMPVRVTVGERSLAQGGVEVRRRRGGETRVVPLAGAVAGIREQIRSLREEKEQALSRVPAHEDHV
jgi:prolyl-tRNA synthetase